MHIGMGMSISRIFFSAHVKSRMLERDISVEEVMQAVKLGTTIKVYPDDIPYPSELILYWSDLRPLHIVVATCEADKVLFIVTLYEPDVHRWEDNFKRRKR